jgi:HNH endonuclease
VQVRLCNGCSRRFQLSELKRGRCPSCLRQYYRERGTTRARGYGGAWKRLSAAVLNRDNYVCRYCGGRATTADHVVPKSKGGSDVMSNLVAACRSCNSGKRDRSPQVSSGVSDFRSFQRKLRDPVFLRQHGGDPALVFREENSQSRMVKRKDSPSAEIVSEVVIRANLREASFRCGSLTPSGSGSRGRRRREISPSPASSAGQHSSEQPTSWNERSRSRVLNRRCSRRRPSAAIASLRASASVAAWISTMCVVGTAPARRTAARW